MLRGLFGSLRGYKGDISPAAALDAVANQREPASDLLMLCSVQLRVDTAPAGPSAGGLPSVVPAPAAPQGGTQRHALPGIFSCQAATNGVSLQPPCCVVSSCSAISLFDQWHHLACCLCIPLCAQLDLPC